MSPDLYDLKGAAAYLDATEDVLDRQIRSGAGPVTWHRVDGSRDAEHVRQAAGQLLAESAVASSLSSR